MGKPQDPRSDEELMVAYVDGDHEALREIHRRYFRVLFGLLRMRLPSEEEARETVQQTFFQLHLARADFRPDAKLRPWLITIALNLARQYHRRRKVRRERPLTEGLGAASEPGPTPLERQQEVARLREALAELPESQRRVIEAHWLEERPFAQVAQEVGASEGAVRVRASRAYTRLRELLSRKT